MGIEIIKTEIHHQHPSKNLGKIDLITKDAVYLDEENDFDSEDERVLKSKCTDFVKRNGGLGNCWAQKNVGNSAVMFCNNLKRSAHPCIQVSLESVLGHSGINLNNLDLSIVIPEFMYPQGEVSAEMSAKLELLARLQSSDLRATGKSFYQDDQHSCLEYKYNHDLYARMNLSPEQSVWLKVEPILWQVKNWHNLPTKVNICGNGKDNTLKLRSYYALLAPSTYSDECAKFKPEDYDTDDTKLQYKRMTSVMWQNSKIRARLNGYNLHAELSRENGNIAYAPEINYDFVGRGFIDEIDHTEVMTKLTTFVGGMNKLKNHQAEQTCNQSL